jgi:hypothetical protein
MTGIGTDRLEQNHNWKKRGGLFRCRKINTPVHLKEERGMAIPIKMYAQRWIPNSAQALGKGASSRSPPVGA